MARHSSLLLALSCGQKRIWEGFAQIPLTMTPPCPLIETWHRATTTRKVNDMNSYIAANGHKMIVVSTHTDSDGREVPDYWNVAHSAACPCLTSEDW